MSAGTSLNDLDESHTTLIWGSAALQCLSTQLLPRPAILCYSNQQEQQELPKFQCYSFLLNPVEGQEFHTLSSWNKARTVRPHQSFPSVLHHLQPQNSSEHAEDDPHNSTYHAQADLANCLDPFHFLSKFLSCYRESDSFPFSQCLFISMTLLNS